jgi:hypothetical protein
MAKANLLQFVEFRREKINLLNVGKITPEDFHDYIYGFITRTKLKPYMKPKNRQQALQSYYYWTSFIERKIVIEEKLLHYNIGSIDLLRESIKIFIKRRDKAVSFLLGDLKEKPNSIEFISKNNVRILTKDNQELISSGTVLFDLGINKPLIHKEIKDNYTRLFVQFLDTL